MLGLAVALAVFGLDARSAHAQRLDAPCGLTSITPGVDPAYPPIARAAHVQGSVIVMTTFAITGQLTATRILSGHPMLNNAALEYLKGWRVNAFPGPRECAIVITFLLVGSAHECKGEEHLAPQKTIFLDPQHAEIQAPAACYTTTY
jgi:TonB family protein